MATEPKPDSSPRVAPAWRGLVLFVGALGGAVAALLAAAMAAICALALLLLAIAAGVVVAIRAGVGGIAGLVRRDRREPDLIEAKHLGGHSWVAYGWDGPH